MFEHGSGSRRSLRVWSHAVNLEGDGLVESKGRETSASFFVSKFPLASTSDFVFYKLLKIIYLPVDYAFHGKNERI